MSWHAETMPRKQKIIIIIVQVMVFANDANANFPFSLSLPLSSITFYYYYYHLRLFVFDILCDTLLHCEHTCGTWAWCASFKILLYCTSRFQSVSGNNIHCFADTISAFFSLFFSLRFIPISLHLSKQFQRHEQQFSFLCWLNSCSHAARFHFINIYIFLIYFLFFTLL